VPLIHVRAALAGRFELLEEASLDGSPVSDESDRIFFVYRHLPAGNPDDEMAVGSPQR
jgi:hypothetical protein